MICQMVDDDGKSRKKKKWEHSVPAGDHANRSNLNRKNTHAIDTQIYK